MDKEVIRKKKQLYDEKSKNLQVKPWTEEELNKIARTTELTNDNEFRRQFQGLEEDKVLMLEQFLKIGYWKSKTLILQEAPKILLALSESSYQGLPAKDTKNVVKEHIKKIDEMASNPEVHTMFGVDVKGMDRVERLQKFLKIDEESTAFKALQKDKEEIENYKAVFSSSGRNIVKDEWMDVECALEGVEIPIVEANNIDKVGDCMDESMRTPP